MIKKIRNLLILACLVVAAFRFTPMQHYYQMCGWLANYRPHIYIPMHTCIYLESYGSSSWQVVTWMYTIKP